MRPAYFRSLARNVLPSSLLRTVQDLISGSSFRRTLQAPRRVARLVSRGASFVFFGFCVANTAFTVVGYPACVSGESMKPTLNASNLHPALSWLWLNVDWVFVNCWAARNYQFERGQIVVLVSPKDPYDYIIKRLIGVEGDIIVNSKHSLPPVTLDAGSVWIEGDNRSNSVDSGYYGPVSKGLIFGKATHVIWPPERWRRLRPEIPEIEGRRVERQGNSGNNVVIVNIPKGDWVV